MTVQRGKGLLDEALASAEDFVAWLEDQTDRTFEVADGKACPLACYLEERGFHVVCVHPGWVETEEDTIRFSYGEWPRTFQFRALQEDWVLSGERCVELMREVMA